MSGGSAPCTPRHQDVEMLSLILLAAFAFISFIVGALFVGLVAGEREGLAPRPFFRGARGRQPR